MIRPLQNRLLIEPIMPEAMCNGLWVPSDKTTFRIDSPNAPITAITRGKVVARGPDVTGVDLGNVVQFSDSCVRPVRDSGKDYVFIREDDVALIEE